MVSKKIAKKLRVGLLQYPISPSFEKNLIQVELLLKKIAAKKPNIVTCPEMWLGSPPEKIHATLWAKKYEAALPLIKKYCALHKIGLFFSALEAHRGKFYNTAYFIDKSGFVVWSYRKIHLFRFSGEDKIYSAGHLTQTFKTTLGHFAGIICFDIRFPELSRLLAHAGPSLLFVCAQWPKSRLDHWTTLLRARAIENQMFVIGVNRLGTKNGDVFSGGSAVFDPWGNEILRLGPKDIMGVIDINLSLVSTIRKKFPFFSERRGKFLWKIRSK